MSATVKVSCVQCKATTHMETKSRRDLFRVKMRIIKRIRRAKQLEAFWLASVRHTARQGGKTQ